MKMYPKRLAAGFRPDPLGSLQGSPVLLDLKALGRDRGMGKDRRGQRTEREGE